MIRPTVDGRCDNAHRNRMDLMIPPPKGEPRSKPRVRNVQELRWLMLSVNPLPKPRRWWQFWRRA